MNSSDLFEAWRLADQAARTAERSLFCEAMRSVDGMCDFPSSAKTEHGKNLRARANELFEIAMAKMNERQSDASPSYWFPSDARPRIPSGAAGGPEPECDGSDGAGGPQARSGRAFA
jgi:hypothetical protein